MPEFDHDAGAELETPTDSELLAEAGLDARATQWHKVVTFQDGLIDMFEKHATTGRLVYVEGKLQTRSWRKEGEDSDRFATEILLVPGGRVQFLDKPNGNGGKMQPDPDAAGDPGALPAGGAPAQADNSETDEIPF